MCTALTNTRDIHSTEDVRVCPIQLQAFCLVRVVLPAQRVCTTSSGGQSILTCHRHVFALATTCLSAERLWFTTMGQNGWRKLEEYNTCSVSRVNCLCQHLVVKVRYVVSRNCNGQFERKAVLKFIARR